MQGCKMLFRSGSSLQPPQDLIVSRLECRPFVAPDGSVKVSSTAKNSHYHLRFECLTKADSSFSPQCLVIPDNVKEKLSDLHKQHLLNTFNITV